MSSARKGREFYSRHYDKVIELHKSGMPVKEIASRLGLSYSAVYHWAKGLRKPEEGNLMGFLSLLRSGPKSAHDMKQSFPKHDELYHIAKKRGLPVQRFVMPEPKLGDKRYWYFMPGQEEQLRQEIAKMLEKRAAERERLLVELDKALEILKQVQKSKP